MSGRIVEDHARQILDMSRGEDYVATVSDHAREDRETLHRYGVFTSPAEKDIDRGCDLVRSRLRIQPNGKPKLYILSQALAESDRRLAASKRPTSTREEFDAYIDRWIKNGQRVSAVWCVVVPGEPEGVDLGVAGGAVRVLGVRLKFVA